MDAGSFVAKKRKQGEWKKGKRPFPDDVELKFFDLMLFTPANDSKIGGVVLVEGTISEPTPGPYNIVAPSQGLAGFQRTGLKIYLRSLQVKWHVQRIKSNFTDVTQTVQGFRVRLAVVLDRQCNGASPAFDEIFDTGNPTMSTVDCYPLVSGSSRFKVLRDTVITCNVDAFTAVWDTEFDAPAFFYPGKSWHEEMYVVFDEPIIVSFKDGDFDIESMRDVGIWACVASDLDYDVLAVECSSRIRFTDS